LNRFLLPGEIEQFWSNQKVMHRLLLSIAIACSSPLAAFCQTTIVDTNALPQVFAPGVVSTPYEEWATSFSPDGHTVYWSQGAVYWTIVFSQRSGNSWSTPKVAPFSGAWNDTDPFAGPDGKRLFFVSNRPLDNQGQTPQQHFHIWYVDRLPDGNWSAPQHLGAPVNLDSVNNYAPSVSRSGTLYFCSRDREGHKGMNGFSAHWNGTGYDAPQVLTFSGLDESQDPFISADEHYVVFVNGNDLYVAFRQGTGWGAPQKLGPQINNGDGISSPYVSADGTSLYYSSNRIKGLYKRDRTHPLDYQGLIKELQSPFNGTGNILVIPVHLPSTI
jgi:Tol biopolymer transport system component